MLPHVSHIKDKPGGIPRVVEAYAKYLPKFGIELVEPDATTYDLKAVHAGMTGGDCDVAHLHGLYWTADYNADEWEWRVNARVIEACRNAKVITVPSAWVAEPFKRDMRLSPVVIPHGIDWQDWQHKYPTGGYVLWNKTRRFDVCDNGILDILMDQFPDTLFYSTLPTPLLQNVHTSDYPANFKIIESAGGTSHSIMKRFIQEAGVYLSTTKETFGIGTLEAMAAGVPVLGWANGGNLDLVQHGTNGYLARPGDIEDLIFGLNYCLKNRRVLGQNGIELAKNWGWETVCEQVANVYRAATVDQPPTVGVVIPVYNKTQEQLDRAINSVKAQTVKPDKIIVVDDGSNIGYDIVVKHLWQQNQGVAVARNTGIKWLDTKYIICLDADDFVEPGFVAACLPALESDRSLGIAYTGLMTVTEHGNEVSQWPPEFNYDRQLQRHNQVPTCAMFRRDAWARVGGYQPRYCPNGAGSEDAAFWTAIGAIGYSAKKITVDNSEKISRVMGEIETIKKSLSIYDSIPDPTTEVEKYDEFATLNNALIIKREELKTLQREDGTALLLFNYSYGSGFASGNPDYREVDWLTMYPWVTDRQHPFASVATPARHSHPVRQYDEPVISVIIPVGPGHEDEVRRALDSLEMQHFRRWEAVVVFDTGNEYYPDLMTAYPYIRPVYTDKRGAGYARNRGVEAARGGMIFYLDADDVLVDPSAFDKMLNAWNETGEIIYTDYLGKAIWNEQEALKEFGTDLLNFNPKTGAAVFRKQAADYDSKLAQVQPLHNPDSQNMPYYHWCLVSVLMPKAWHCGFDESLKTWEDVEYFWRLARLGRCFYRLPEPLVMYNYHKGTRREASAVVDTDSRQKHKSLVQYIKTKLEDIKTVGCNCGQRAAQKQQPLEANMADNEFVEIEFHFSGDDSRGNYGKGLKSPTGQTSNGVKLDYQGYNRRAGDRFLVHIKDQQARPDMFKLVPAEIKAPVVETKPLDAPILLKPEKVEMAAVTPTKRGRKIK